MNTLYPEDWQAQVILGMLREVDPLTVVDGVDLEDEVLSAEFDTDCLRPLPAEQ